MRFDQEPNTAATDHLVVALAHPSLERAVTAFSEQLTSEQRFFGTAAPKLPSSSLEHLTTQGGIRLGVMVGHRLVGMSRVEDDGSAVIAVVQPWRGHGVGRQLLGSTLERAATLGHERVTFRSCWRSRAFIGLAESTGATVVDHGRGRIDLIFALERCTHIA
jgi:GNAT superfamily N-acetyltransferase